MVLLGIGLFVNGFPYYFVFELTRLSRWFILSLCMLYGVFSIQSQAVEEKNLANCNVCQKELARIVCTLPGRPFNFSCLSHELYHRLGTEFHIRIDHSLYMWSIRKTDNNRESTHKTRNNVTRKHSFGYRADHARHHHHMQLYNIIKCVNKHQTSYSHISCICCIRQSASANGCYTLFWLQLDAVSTTPIDSIVQSILSCI